MKYIYIIKEIIKGNIILTAIFLFEIVFVSIFLMFNIEKISELNRDNGLNENYFEKTTVSMPDFFVQEALINDKSTAVEKEELIKEYSNELRSITDNKVRLSEINIFDVEINNENGLLMTYDEDTLNLLGFDIDSNDGILLKRGNSSLGINSYNFTPSNVNEKGEEIKYKDKTVNIIKKEKYSGKLLYPGYVSYTNNINHLDQLYIEAETDFVVIMKKQTDLPISNDLSRIIYLNDINDIILEKLDEIGFNKSLSNINISTIKLDNESINQALSLDIPVYITTIVTFVAMSYVNILRQKKKFNIYRIVGANKFDLYVGYFMYLTIVFILSICLSKIILDTGYFVEDYELSKLFTVSLFLYGITSLISIYPIKSLVKNTIIFERKE